MIGADKSFVSPLKVAALFILVLSVLCSPIWGVRYFVNQDGSGHLYTSYVIDELIRGNSFFSSAFAFSSFAVPNSSGHWLMAGLLTFLAPEIVTKVVLSLTLAVFAGAVVCLRVWTAGRSELGLTVLFAFVIGANWLWMQGAYNYVLAAAASTFTIALFYKWREHFTVLRVLVIAGLVLFVFFGHLISFAVLIGSLIVIALFSPERSRGRAIGAIAAALILSIPLMLSYLGLGRSEGEPFSPAWRSLSDSLTISALVEQLFSADPFVFISRKTFPFYNGTSYTFLLFSPILWVFLATMLMLVSTLVALRSDRSTYKPEITFAVLSGFSIVGALIGPDDFGLQNGSILRERLLLAGLVFFVPFFRTCGSKMIRIAAFAALSFVILFQSAAYWEYAIRSNAQARAFFAARSAVPENSRIASIRLFEDDSRFHSEPVSQLVNYLGINKNVIIWDNYEFGHYMFPVVFLRPEDRRFAFELSTAHVFYLNNSAGSYEQTLMNHRTNLENGHEKIDLIVVYGTDSRLDDIIRNWYGPQPVFSENNLNLYQRRN